MATHSSTVWVGKPPSGSPWKLKVTGFEDGDHPYNMTWLDNNKDKTDEDGFMLLEGFAYKYKYAEPISFPISFPKPKGNSFLMEEANVVLNLLCRHGYEVVSTNSGTDAEDNLAFIVWTLKCALFDNSVRVNTTHEFPAAYNVEEKLDTVLKKMNTLIEHFKLTQK